MNIRTEIEHFRLVAVSKKIKNANAVIPRNVQWTLYIIILGISDAAMTFLAFWLAYYFRFEFFVKYVDPDAVPAFDTYRFLLCSMPILWLGIFAANGLYTKDNLLGGTREY